MKKQKKEPWRWILGALAVAYILFLWAKKDVVSLYAAMPAEQFLPLIVTTVGVSLVKVAGIAAAIWIIKWLIGKLKP